MLSVVRVGQVHLFYLAQLLSDRFDPGHETIEARLFTEDEIPWEEIAFRTVRETLLRYFEDRRKGGFARAHGRHRLNVHKPSAHAAVRLRAVLHALPPGAVDWPSRACAGRNRSAKSTRCSS